MLGASQNPMIILFEIEKRVLKEDLLSSVWIFVQPHLHINTSSNMSLAEHIMHHTASPAKRL